MKKFLSAEELREKRCLPRSLPEKAASKGCGPDDDIVGEVRLEHLLDDRLKALGEPKVEKLSSLIKGEWLPDKRAIRVVKPVGKHLQHMGYTADAQQMLYPEEALFLMDSKCMEVYYKSIPMSEQEAYSVFFVSESDLHKYQVYGHLTRLGYTVIRHQGRSAVSNYERTIKLDKYLKHARQTHKTRHDSPKADSSDSEMQPLCAMADKDADFISPVENEWCSFTGNTTGAPRARLRPEQSCMLSRHPEIIIPDAYGKSLFGIRAPEPHHLPPNVLLHKQMYMLDLQKLYCRRNMSNRTHKAHVSRRHKDAGSSLAMRLIEVPEGSVSSEDHGPHKRSRPEQTGLWRTRRNSPERTGSWRMRRDSPEHTGSWRTRRNSPERTGSWRTRRDSSPQNSGDVHLRPGAKRGFSESESGRNLPEITSKSRVKTGARSWGQYKQELAPLTEPVPAIEMLATPNIRPLLEPAKATSTAAILSALQIVKSVNLTESSSLPDPPDTSLLELTYDVYLPNVAYKKNASMLPNHRLVVTSASDPLPEVIQIMRTMKHMQDGVAIHFAVVTSGDVAFYSFKDVRLPVLVSMG